MKTSEQHKERHIKLHNHLDELLADYIIETKNLPSKCSIQDLLNWSYEQTLDPSDNFNRFTDL